MAKFWKAINQSCVTSVQFHFSIQLNSEIFDIIRYPEIVEVSKFNASSRRPLTHCECVFSMNSRKLNSRLVSIKITFAPPVGSPGNPFCWPIRDNASTSIFVTLRL